MAHPSVALAPSSTEAAPAGRLWAAWASLPVVVRYGVAGLGTQGVYLTALWLALVGGMHYVLAISVAQVTAMAFAFPTYRSKVFEQRGSIPRQFVAFVGVWWTGAAMSFIGVPVLVESLGMHPLPAQLCVLVVVVVSSFLAHRRLTFGDRVSRVPRP